MVALERSCCLSIYGLLYRGRETWHDSKFCRVGTRAFVLVRLVVRAALVVDAKIMDGSGRDRKAIKVEGDSHFT